MPTTKAQQEEILKIFREADEDQGGSLDFYEFLHLLRRFVDESEQKRLKKERVIVKETNFANDEVSSWREIYLKFDQDNSGQIESGEARALLQAVGVTLSSRTLNEDYLDAFNAADRDGNGTLDFPEFLLLIKGFIDSDFGGVRTRLKFDASGREKKAQKIVVRKNRRQATFEL
jgi:Ca2+-binding EF-hand superfamily protein